MQELAELAIVPGESVQRLHAVDDDDPWAHLFEEAVDRGQDAGQALLDEDLAKVVVDDPPFGNCATVEEAEALAVPEDLVERL